MVTITLLVEDNPRIRENLIPTLEDLTNAHVLGFAETEADAMEWLTAHDGQWSLAVVDLFFERGFRFGRPAGLPRSSNTSTCGAADELRHT